MLAPSHAHGQCPLDCRHCYGESGSATTSSKDVSISTREQESTRGPSVSGQSTSEQSIGEQDFSGQTLSTRSLNYSARIKTLRAQSVHQALRVDRSFAVPLEEQRTISFRPAQDVSGKASSCVTPSQSETLDRSNYAFDQSQISDQSQKIDHAQKIDQARRRVTTTFTITSDCSPESSLAKGASLLAGLEEVRRNMISVDSDAYVSQSEANSVWSATWSESQKAWFCILNKEPDVPKNYDEFNQIVPMIMHDVKSPLSTIQLCLEIVAALTDKQNDEQLSRAVARARANAERVQNLADEVLLMEKIKSDTINLNMVPVSLQTVVLDCADTLTALAEEHDVEIEAYGMDTVVIADRLRLSQILQNLLSNAIRFSPRGSSVQISSEPCVVEDRDFIRISVKDQGPGIPKSMIGEIFQAFKQAAIGKSRSISYGLGLAICDRLVALQGGRIWVESDEDRGCTFHVELPR